MSLAADKATSTRLTNVRVSMSRVAFMLDGSPAFARTPRASYDLVQFMHRAGLDFAAAPVSSAAALVPLAFPLIWLGALYSVMRKQMTGATKSVGKRASARLDPTELSFEDVAGVPDALVEVREIVDMLQDSAAFDKVGARLPAGVLMVGPPGTGKTLLARVMAAQARVPFFYCSGSDFVELFIGRGAARMRALFKEASEASPSIIFIDELDALGKQRAMRMAGNDEVEQTLNQMLACMDGLETKAGVVVMAATNRYEILDQALVRPGRFDRLVRISLPDEEGRLAILKVHVRKLQLEADVQLPLVAGAARGFSGAELAALCNEAAIRAARRQSAVINMQDFTSALVQYTTARSGAPLGQGLLNKLMGVA